jgi:hypothetical protein
LKEARLLLDKVEKEGNILDKKNFLEDLKGIF